MNKKRQILVSLATALTIFFSIQSVLAHVTISPRESTTGASETYTIRVPTERGSPTVRIEIEFPMGVTISNIEATSGWDVEATTNGDGRIESAVWSGGSIAQGESEEFKFTAENPSEEDSIVWKVVQVHADGSRAEWIGERGSRNPAPVVEIQNN